MRAGEGLGGWCGAWGLGDAAGGTESPARGQSPRAVSKNACLIRMGAAGGEGGEEEAPEAEQEGRRQRPQVRGEGTRTGGGRGSSGRTAARTCRRCRGEVCRRTRLSHFLFACVVSECWRQLVQRWSSCRPFARRDKICSSGTKAVRCEGRSGPHVWLMSFAKWRLGRRMRV